jgi:ABC-type Mn2+/Zn2+ transport system ATPase subunit
MYNFESFAVQIQSRVLIQPQALVLPEKGFLLVVGANGVGKTTFLRQIGNSFLKLNRDLKISFVSSIQVYERSLPLSGREFYKLFSSQSWPQNLQEVFGHLLEKRIDRMSSGEFQALVLISNFMEDSDILLIDEPLSHLSPDWSKFFTNWMSQLKEKKVLIVASHQIDLLTEVSDQIYELKNKHLILKVENPKESHHEYI